MSILSHNRGKERTHDPDQTHRKPCAHNRTEKLKWTQDHLHKILTRFKLWPGWKPWSSKILVLRQSCQDTLQVKSRHHPEVRSPTKRKEVVIQHSQTTMSELNRDLKTRTGITSCHKVKNETREDLQVQIHMKITKTPQHCHCFVKKPMIK